MYPEKLRVKFFESNNYEGEDIFILSDSKSLAAPKKPVYQGSDNTDWYIYFYPNHSGGWVVGTEDVFEENKGGYQYKSKDFSLQLITSYHFVKDYQILNSFEIIIVSKIR